MPEKCRRDANKGTIWELLLPFLYDLMRYIREGRSLSYHWIYTDLQRLFIYDNLMESCLDEAARDMFKLLSGLHEQVVACRNFYGNAFACVTSPHMKAGVPWTPMDSQKVQVGVETSQNGVLLTIFDQIRSSWCEQMWTGKASLTRI